VLASLNLGNERLKAARRTLMKLTPAGRLTRHGSLIAINIYYTAFLKLLGEQFLALLNDTMPFSSKLYDIL